MKTKSIYILLICLVLTLGMALTGCSRDESKESSSSSESGSSEKSDEQKGFIKSLPVKFGDYMPETGKAGDFDFNAGTPTFNQIMIDYGFEVPANSVGPAKLNPQPTFYLPLGTNVLSMVDGIVFDVPKLYSNDYSIMIQAEGGDLIFETEHVIDPRVKKGDKVKAGQVIAKVSDYDERNTPGLGLVEMGVLVGGNPPYHVCPTDYFHESVKDKLEKQIIELHESWGVFSGDSSTYDESNYVVPGCKTKEKIEG